MTVLEKYVTFFDKNENKRDFLKTFNLLRYVAVKVFNSLDKYLVASLLPLLGSINFNLRLTIKILR